MSIPENAGKVHMNLFGDYTTVGWITGQKKGGQTTAVVLLVSLVVFLDAER